MKRYAIRRNPATGRWIIYAYLHWRPDSVRPSYGIIGDADTQQNALEGIFE